MKVFGLLFAGVALCNGEVSSLRENLFMQMKSDENDVCQNIADFRAQAQISGSPEETERQYNRELRLCIKTQTRSSDSNCTLNMGRSACIETNGCVWFARSNTCADSPCRFLNNGLCATQFTGGQCVWLNRGDARGVHPETGANLTASSPGCYSNPCASLADNSEKSCSAVGSSHKYSCQWCRNHGGVRGCFIDNGTPDNSQPCGVRACPNGNCMRCQKGTTCDCLRRLGYSPSFNRTKCRGTNLKGLKRYTLPPTNE
mmetsp:Transcript_18720/g.30562  ORF Transcript_18720/g.30562 Transcript_18720/m.30562 type:complete len:258 (+) Transcript_18720:42-815(+)